MPVGAFIALVIVVVLLAAMVAAVLLLRRMALRRRFGPEYDRLAAEVGSRRASAELAERRRRVDKLDIRPLGAGKRAAYTDEWTTLQERFVDGPARSAQAAGALVTAVAADCGYSVGDTDGFLTDLSVYHAHLLGEYRRARQTTERGGAPTEELRQALLGYRAMFLDLLWAPDNTVDRPASLARAERRAERAAAANAISAENAAADGADDTTMAQPTRKG